MGGQRRRRRIRSAVQRLPGSDAAGGSVQLVKLIDEHGSAVAADLLRYYQVDLRDLWRDGCDLTPRWLLWLVEHLPEDSATAASMRGGAHLRAWTSSVSLQAAITNLLFVANRQRAGRPTKKLPIQPPKAKKTRRVVRVADMIARHQK